LGPDQLQKHAQTGTAKPCNPKGSQALPWGHIECCSLFVLVGKGIARHCAMLPSSQPQLLKMTSSVMHQWLDFPLEYFTSS
jgi:hypothetical protein